MSNHAERRRWLFPVPLSVFSGLLVRAAFVQRKVAPGAAVMVQREALRAASARSVPAAVAGCSVLPVVREALRAAPARPVPAMAAGCSVLPVVREALQADRGLQTAHMHKR